MRKTIAMKWARALESEKYRQGRGALKSGSQFCCLGVLCEIAPKGTVKTKLKPKGARDTAYDGMTGVPPASVKKWAGLACDNPTLEPTLGTLKGRATRLNDDVKLTFNEIAALIRKNWATI